MSLFPPQHKAKAPNPFRLVVDVATPARDEVRSKDLVSLRVAAGRAYARATGMATAPDLTEEQLFWGGLKSGDRARFLAIYLPTLPKPRI